MSKIKFSQKVYNVVKIIPKGKILTYQDVAMLAGSPRASRAVGTALKNNTNKKSVPCHRVVNANGGCGGYVFGGKEVKIKILKKEGVRFRGNKVDLNQSRWKIK